MARKVTQSGFGSKRLEKSVGRFTRVAVVVVVAAAGRVRKARGGGGRSRTNAS